MNEPLVTEVADGFAWRLDPGFARRLQHCGAGLQNWLTAGHAAIVKNGPHRVVYRVTLDGSTFFVKHNRGGASLTRLRERMLTCKAQREFDNAAEAAARGVATALPLGWAQDGSSRAESLFITQALEDVRPLQEFLHEMPPTWTHQRRTRWRQKLARVLGQLLARMHDAGLSHRDLHAGNLMIRNGVNDTPELFLIDLTDVRFGASLLRHASLENLAILNHWFIFQASRTDRLRFFHSYWNCRKLFDDGEFHVAARGLETATWASLQCFWNRRDRRCLAANRYYQRLRGAQTAGHAATDLDADLIAALVADPDAPFHRPDAVRHKDSATSTVVEFTGCVRGQPRQLIYKRFRVKRASAPWRSLVRRPPALHSWQMGQGLRERCLPTARPLLVLHRRRRGLFHEGYLLTVKIEHAEPLHACLYKMNCLPERDRLRQQRARIAKVAQAVRELHARNLSQRDLKADNILVAESSDATSPEYDSSYPGHNWVPANLVGVWFVDLVGMTVHKRLSRRRVVQNLARLNASFHWRPELSRTDRLRFLRTYMQWALRGKEGWKSLWIAIGGVTQAKLMRNQRVGRLVA